MINIGYGRCKENFTIEERELAIFHDVADAKVYIQMLYDNYYYKGREIFYIQEVGKEKKIYLPEKKSFVSAEEILSGKEKCIVPGWEVSATFYTGDESGDYEYESSVALSYRESEKMKAGYIEDGAMEVEIDDIDLDVQRYFWNTEKFFKRSVQTETEKQIIANEINKEKYRDEPER